MLTHGSLSMVYDGDGNRVSETVGSTTTKFLVDSLNPTKLPQVMDELVNGSATRTYTYGRQLISENQFSGSTWTPTFYGYDGHGNVRFLANSSGTVTDSYTYDAFGMPISSSGTTANDLRYSGEWLDPNLSFYNLRARYYNQATGRFWTMDPLQHKPCCGSGSCSARGSSSYTYADDDPTDKIDPTGRDAAIEYLVDLRPLVIASGALAALALSIECSEQLTKCIEDCQYEQDNGGEWPFRRCVADCMLKHGCNAIGPLPWYNPPSQ